MKALTSKFLLLTTILVLSSNVVFGQFDWTKDARNPIFSGSGNGTWDKHVMGPMVLFNADSNRYEMFYTGSYGPEVSWYPYRTGFAWSVDGINWTKYSGNPVLTPDPGSWDEGGVEFPWVIRENGQYKMWYTGFNNNIRQIGYATSPDGIIWTKYAGNPILTTGTANWETNSVEYCTVLFKSGLYTMYYTGVENIQMPRKIGRATSLDGINWQRDTINNPVLSGTTGQWDNGGVIGPVCLNTDSLIYMWYTSWNSSGTVSKIGLATSTNDGITWMKYISNPVLVPGPSGSWDGNYVEVQTVLLLNNSVFQMWYDGSRDNTVTNLWRVGIATSTLVVPVELTSFTAEALNQKVILKWITATELNNNGFEIQRRVAESEFATVGFVKGEGTTTNQKEYSYVDKDLVDGKYYYRLKQCDFNGTYEYSNIIEVDVRSLDEYALENNYPNPFNPTTTIGYVLKEKTNAKLILLNAIGEEVAVLVNEEQEQGFHKIDFNASTLASGVYFYRLQAGDFVQTKKMILLK